MPRLRRCTGTAVTSVPPTSMRPSSGSSKPGVRLNVVVLPQPGGPSSAKNSPASTARSTASTARVMPSKLLLTRARRTEAAARPLTASVIATRPSVGSGGRSCPQQARNPRVDLVFARVVPFPIHLDEGLDLGLGIVKPSGVFRTERHLAVRRRVPHGFGERLLYRRPQHEVDIRIGEILDLRARRDAPH